EAVTGVDTHVGNIVVEEHDIAGLQVRAVHGGAVGGLRRTRARYLLTDLRERPLHQTRAVELIGPGGAPDVGVADAGEPGGQGTRPVAGDEIGQQAVAVETGRERGTGEGG